MNESEAVILSRFRSGLREELKRELYLREVKDLEQAYQVARDFEQFHRAPAYRKIEPTRSLYPRPAQPNPSRPHLAHPNLSRPDQNRTDLSRPESSRPSLVRPSPS